MVGANNDDDATAPTETFRGEDGTVEDLLAGNFIDLNALVVRRDVADAVGPFDETLRRWIDWEWLLRIARHAGMPAYVPVIGRRLRQRPRRPPGLVRAAGVVAGGRPRTPTASTGMPSRARTADRGPRVRRRPDVPRLDDDRRAVDAVLGRRRPRRRRRRGGRRRQRLAPLGHRRARRLVPGRTPRGAAARGPQPQLRARQRPRARPLHRRRRGDAQQRHRGRHRLAPTARHRARRPDRARRPAAAALPGRHRAGRRHRVRRRQGPALALPRRAPAVRRDRALSDPAARRFSAITAAAAAFRASDLLRWHGFDPVYANGLEDVDLCLRALADAPEGSAFLVEPASVVVHHESRTEGRDDARIEKPPGVRRAVARTLPGVRRPHRGTRPRGSGTPGLAPGMPKGHAVMVRSSGRWWCARCTPSLRVVA